MNAFIIAGLFINLAYNLINRFVVKIPCKIAIPLLVLGITCLGVGLAQMGQGGLLCGRK